MMADAPGFYMATVLEFLDIWSIEVKLLVDVAMVFLIIHIFCSKIVKNKVVSKMKSIS